MQFVVLALHQFFAVIDRPVCLGEDAVGLTQHVEGLDVEVGLDEIEGAHVLDEPQGQQVEDILKSAWGERYRK